MLSIIWVGDCDLVDLLRLFYISSSALILLVCLVPSLSSRYLSYGARSVTNTSNISRVDDKVGSSSNSRFSDFLDLLASINVPHSWFIHFYVVSTISSLIWLHQLLTRGFLFRAVTEHVLLQQQSMETAQIALCWLLLFFQGSRRLYECVSLSKPSTSQMWLGHYIIGLAFYVATGLAVWVEGTSNLNETVGIYGQATPEIFLLNMNAIFFTISFFLASFLQHNYHVYLSSLEKYTLPTRGAFKYIVAPHYTAECVIYLCLARLTAPNGAWLNGTLLSALCFVACNLGVSACGTKEWMKKKFGTKSVQHRWTMIPGIW